MSATAHSPTSKPLAERDRVTIRFAGDSGDGMQLVGSQFSAAAAALGNDVRTMPDFPAEIRAPAGSLPGVSAFQINFASSDIFTPGDQPDVLVAMNPAALKANLEDLPPAGIIVVDEDEFTAANLKKANYDSNPLEDNSLDGFLVHAVPIGSTTQRALVDTALTPQQRSRCKNFFALGLMCWLYDRALDPTIAFIDEKFAHRPALREANVAALKAGHAFAETAEMFTEHYRVPKAQLKPGTYRTVTGNTATALGFVAAAQITGKQLFYGSYPITPASEVLHELARLKRFGVKTFQAEDEISAVGSAIGAAYGGALALTGTSGPGLALKSEAIGMAVMTELPLVIIDVQRAGPSTGMPTKTEQSDLLQAMFGRNGESPVAVIAPASPADCFWMAIEAFRIACLHMTPVVMLTDGYLGNGAEPWRIPTPAELPRFSIEHPEPSEGFMPYARDERLVRPWAVPGTPGLEHRIGTLEKHHLTGNVSYDPENHARMTEMRAEKVQRIADDIVDAELCGGDSGDVLVIGWGSTYGAIRVAVRRHQQRGAAVSHLHLRHLNPFPNNVSPLLGTFRRVLVPELNSGQLLMLLRARYLVAAEGLNKVTGQPLSIFEIENRLSEMLADAGGVRS